MVPQAIMIREFGSSSVLHIEEVNIGSPGEGELFISQSAIGVHYHDIYVRTGLYKTLNLPGIPGIEATGIVESIGSGVKGFKRGDRIVYVTSSYGAYATHRLLDARLAVKLPEFVSDELIVTNFSRALTVQMLTKQVLNIQSSHTILVTAASGGVGRLLCQYANSLGIRVIGSVSTSEKTEVARSYGCDYSLIYGQKDFIRMVMDITDGKGVDVVYDSVGADTFCHSLEALSLCGHLVNFGQSSGPVGPLQMATLSEKSLTVTRPILFHYIADTEIYKTMVDSVFNTFREGTLSLPPAEPYSLEDASVAHNILESRRGGGSLYLIP